MKKLNRLISPLGAFPLMLLVAAVLCQGCGPTTGSCPPPQTNKTFPVLNLGYGAGAYVDVTQYDAIKLRRGDQVTLLFPCPPTVGALPSATAAGLTVTISGNTALVTVSTTGVSPGTSLLLPFSTPSYEFTVHVVGDVWPGDANADGRRNMHDLMPIALAMRNQISGPGPGPVLNYPPDTTQMKGFQDVADWDTTFVFGARTIDFKHADCNLDGKITLEDAEYLRAVLGPVAPPDFLQDAVNGMTLRAVYDTLNPIDVVITEDGQMGVRIGFDIEVQNANGFADSIFGVLFTRPVTETADYQVDTTSFRFLSGNLFGVEKPELMLWGQRFWHELDIVNSSQACAQVIDKPLDVGVFKVLGPLSPLDSTGSARCGNCQVTLLDILKTGQPLPPTLDFQHHLINGVAYSYGNGGISINSIACEDTSRMIDLDVLCKEGVSKPVIRDYVQDNGSESTAHPKAWNSPDIWVRLQIDTLKEHQPPVPGQDAYFKVRVHNPSCTQIDNATVTLYAAEYNTSLQANNLSQMGTATNVTIPQWGSTIVTIRSKFNVQLNQDDPDAATYTLLATVGTPTNPAPSFPAGQITSVVLNKATVAMRNTKTLRAADGTQTVAEFPLGAIASSAGSIKLKLKLIQGSTSHPASNYGNLVVQVAGASSPIGFANVPNTNIYQLEANITEAELTLNSSTPVTVSYTKNPGGPTGPLSYTYLLWATVGGIDYPGITFKITLP
jgi:hypothetical protein